MNAPRPTTTRPDRGFRRTLAVGLLISVLVHLAVALAWRSSVLEPPSRPPADRSAVPARTAAGGALRAVSLRRVETTEISRRPEPVEAADEPDVRLPRVAESTLTSGELDRPGTGPAPAEGSSGPAGAPVVRPPVPRSVIPEWDAPASVRGRSVTVRVHVDSAGAATGAVELVPRTPDEDFNRRLVRKVRAMRFRPARDRRGRPVAAWAELTFSF